MKIYRLDVNKVTEPTGAVVSSYVSPRQTTKQEFYLSKEKAEKRRDEIYEGLQKLIGFISGFEAVIKEIEVIE